MIKTILLSSILLICFFFTANAQTDTTHYDLGRISVNKNFTQTITIKGSDLERYQFSDLADAINVWLYGTYSNASTLIYAIDGNIITDVNAYSIYDIDEITLVQNALAQVSGAAPGQQMVLIKLKTNRKGKQGVEATGQTSLIDMANQANTPGVKSTTNVYDHYYLSGYKNLENADFGASVDYQRDALPDLTNSSYQYDAPFHFDRFKFNGYADAKLWKGTTVNFRINYAPQGSKGVYDYYDQAGAPEVSDNYYYYNRVTQHMVNANLAIVSQIAKGLTNTLSGAYTHYNYFEVDSVNSTNITNSYPPFYNNEYAHVNDNSHNLLIRDNLSYHVKLGFLEIEPAVNFSYRNFRDSTYENSVTLGYTSQLGIPAYNSLTLTNAISYKLYELSPSLNVSYRDILNIQGGFVSIMNKPEDIDPDYSIPRVSPFLTAAIIVSKALNFDDVILNVFGSFSRQNSILNDEYSNLEGFGLVAQQGTQNAYIFPVAGTANVPDHIIPVTAYNPLQQLSTYQVGLNLLLLKNLSLSYNYLNSYSPSFAEVEKIDPPFYQFYDIPYYSNQITNRIGLNYNFHSGNFSWRGGLNVAEEKLNVAKDTNFAAYYKAGYLTNGNRYSGGFTNRFTCKTLFAGLDVLYQLGERPLTLINVTSSTPLAQPHVNSVSLQNLYIGSQIKITGVKYAEAFVNTRNILQNNSSDITDNRRFYGIGVKVGW